MSLGKKIKNFLLSKKFLINLGAVILLNIILIFGFKAYLNATTNQGERVKVPNLIGQNQKNIDKLLANTGLEYQILDSIYDPSKIAGTILQQDPEPTDVSKVFVKSGRKVKIRVSKRTRLVEMPDLIFKSERFAEIILKNRGFRYEIEYIPSIEASGAVLEQWYRGKKIEPKTKIPIGSRIKIVVGRREIAGKTPLPDLVGLNLHDAQIRAKELGDFSLLVICSSCKTKQDSVLAVIVSQEPEYEEGKMIPQGSVITVIAE